MRFSQAQLGAQAALAATSLASSTRTELPFGELGLGAARATEAKRAVAMAMNFIFVVVRWLNGLSLGLKEGCLLWLWDEGRRARGSCCQKDSL